MQKAKLRWKAAALAVALLLAAAPFAGTLQAGTASAQETEKLIDVYLIGGQSNAAGYSEYNVKSNVTGTFENVWYAGETDRDRKTSIASSSYLHFAEFKREITTGLGKDADHMGPEFGLAEAIHESYSEEHPALIFKSAAGDTSLLDDQRQSGGNASYGNWYPRSLWEADYTPDPVTQTKGVQYQLFVDNFRTVYTELKNNGYTPVVKAMVWMQGEVDIDHRPYTDYEETLKTFIGDIREDLSDITGSDLTLMPFVIGEIATSFWSYDRADIKEFNVMQRRVAETVPAAYTVQTSDLIIVGPGGNQTDVQGTDTAHFNGKDMRTLGNRFGEAVKTALASSGKKYVTVEQGKNGEVSAAFNIEQTQLTVTISPDEKYKLSSLLINGQEMASSVTGNTLVIDATEEYYKISAAFTKKKALRIALDYDIGCGKVEVDTPVYEGDVLTVKVTPAAGYTVDAVTFGDAALTYDEESGSYVGQAVTADGTLKVTFERLNPADIGNNDNTGLIVGVSIGAAVLVAAAVTAAVLIAKRARTKKNAPNPGDKQTGTKQ